MNSLTQISG